MFELIETLVCYFKGRGKATLAGFLFILGFGYIVLSFFGNNENIISQGDANEVSKFSPKPSTALKGSETLVSRSSVGSRSKETPLPSIPKEKSVKNFVPFKNHLIAITREGGYSAEFSIELARAIQNNLRNKKLSQEDLRKTISQILGNAASPDEVEKIRIFVIQAVTKTAKPYTFLELNNCSQLAIAAFKENNKSHSDCIVSLASRFARDILGKSRGDEEAVTFLTVTSNELPETVRLLTEKCEVSPTKGRQLLLGLWCQPIVEID